MKKKEVTGTWLPGRQGQWAAHRWKDVAVGTASLAKHEVFKEGG